MAGFQVLGELGRGGMGVVWTARHVRLKRLVALKQILTTDPELLARLKTEAEAAARLSHPNIVQIHEVVEQDGLQYLALEYVEGGSLQGLLANGPVPARRAAALVAGLARAMEYAHGRGVLHRDLKPANVLMTEDGTAKVGDFGLAKQLDDDAGQTKAGAVLGTPSYMAPEQAAGLTGEVGPRSDVYALGAILYECLTGRPPFRAATTLETLQQVRYEEPVPPGRLQPGTPWDIQTICLKCLQKAPARRYATAGELADDLERFLAGEPIRSRPVGGAERVWKWARRRPAAAALALAALLGTVAFLTGLLWHQRVMSQEVARANANEAEALRQREVALEHFRKGHETLDAIFTRLNEDLFRVQDERSRRLQQEIAEATLRYYRQVLRNFEDSEPEVRLNRAIVLVYAARIEEVLKSYARAEDDYRAAGRASAATRPGAPR
ncbi:MAG: serine/threonine-protein kinase [Gemmataceae bacterium]